MRFSVLAGNAFWGFSVKTYFCDFRMKTRFGKFDVKTCFPILAGKCGLGFRREKLVFRFSRENTFLWFCQFSCVTK